MAECFRDGSARIIYTPASYPVIHYTAGVVNKYVTIYDPPGSWDVEEVITGLHRVYVSRAFFTDFTCRNQSSNVGGGPIAVGYGPFTIYKDFGCKGPEGDDSGVPQFKITDARGDVMYQQYARWGMSDRTSWSFESIDDEQNKHKITIRDRSGVIHERIVDEEPEVEYIEGDFDPRNTRTLDANLEAVFFRGDYYSAGVEVVGSTEDGAPCIDINRVTEGGPPPALMRRVCSPRTTKRPEYEIECAPCCPSGACSVKCGNHTCCYNERGEVIRRC